MDSGSETGLIGSWSSSSSSFLTGTSFGSELDSNEADLDDAGVTAGDDDEFIAELTRQMADYMLEENEEEDNNNNNNNNNQFSKHPSLQQRSFQEQTRRSYADTVKKSLTSVKSEPNEQLQSQSPLKLPLPLPLQPPVHVYQVENQPRVGGGRKGKGIESTQQQVKTPRHEQQMRGGGGGGYRGGGGGKEFGKVGYGGGGVQQMAVGSGMRAIFLGGSGSRNVMSGTGVFLPRSSSDATDHSRKKIGCSTVLVPTRVLQALEQHFNNIESLSPSAHTQHVNKEKTQTQEPVSVDHQDSKLPQDWIY